MVWLEFEMLSQGRDLDLPRIVSVDLVELTLHRPGGVHRFATLDDADNALFCSLSGWHLVIGP
jgi:hypothetical protein